MKAMLEQDSDAFDRLLQKDSLLTISKASTLRLRSDAPWYVVIRSAFT